MKILMVIFLFTKELFMDLSENEFPPIIWEKMYKKELDEFEDGEIDFSNVKFNIQIIEESSQILNEFKITLSKYDGNLDPASIISEVNILVESLNNLSRKHDNFIETGEREDLCLWIDQQIKNSGYKLKENEDLTFEKREW